jgi:hypothetical protein
LAFETALKTNPPVDGATLAQLGEQTFVDKACRIMDMLHAATTTPGCGDMRVDCLPREGALAEEQAWSKPIPLHRAFSTLQRTCVSTVSMK